MKMQSKTLATAAAVLALAFGASAQQAPAGGTLDKIKSSGKAVLGVREAFEASGIVCEEGPVDTTVSIGVAPVHLRDPWQDIVARLLGVPDGVPDGLLVMDRVFGDDLARGRVGDRVPERHARLRLQHFVRHSGRQLDDFQALRRHVRPRAPAIERFRPGETGHLGEADERACDRARAAE